MAIVMSVMLPRLFNMSQKFIIKKEKVCKVRHIGATQIRIKGHLSIVLGVTRLTAELRSDLEEERVQCIECRVLQRLVGVMTDHLLARRQMREEKGSGGAGSHLKLLKDKSLVTDVESAQNGRVGRHKAEGW